MKKMLACVAILNAALALPAVAADITIGAAFPMSGANAEYRGAVRLRCGWW